MVNDKIIVMGGYGHVGQKICTDLARVYPGKVFAAGRNFERAQAFSHRTQGLVQPFQIDLQSTPVIERLPDTKLVIMCIDQQAPSFTQSCLQQGIHYIDISAQYEWLSQVESLHQTALSSKSTALLSVGLAPGLSNLMALHAKQLLDAAETINISLMLGLGDSHGKAAIEWTMHNLRFNFKTIEQNKELHHISFTDGRRIDFGEALGMRTAYRFNFADQHILPRTLQVPRVSTRLCFDRSSVTGLLAWLKRIGLLNLLNVPFIRAFTVNSFASLQIGDPLFALKVDAIGHANNQPAQAECLLWGRHESDVTAKVAVTLAKKLLSSKVPHGVYHIEQLYNYECFREDLRNLVHMSCRLRMT